MNVEDVHWAVSEVGQADCGDKRRTSRLVAMLAARGQQPTSSLTQCFGASAELRGAYHFYETDAIEPDAILNAHWDATVARVQALPADEVVLVVQDTTDLQQQQLKLKLHSTMAVTPDGVPLGILHQQRWAVSDTPNPIPHDQRALDERESYKWSRGAEAAATLHQAVPDACVVWVGDRESDVFGAWGACYKQAVHFLIRAVQNRRVKSRGKQLLWARLKRCPVMGTLTVRVPRTETHAARVTTLSLRFMRVTVLPPLHHPERATLTPVTVWAILVTETHPPKDVPRIVWKLLTSVETETVEQACTRVAWYTKRWQIEVFHKVLKSGCRVEKRQFEKYEHYLRYVTLDSIVAWRILLLTYLGRSAPDLPCTVCFEVGEWQMLHLCTFPGVPLPATPPRLGDALRWVAQLGGYLGRTADGPPGVTTIWRGMHLLSDYTVAAACLKQNYTLTPK